MVPKATYDSQIKVTTYHEEPQLFPLEQVGRNAAPMPGFDPRTWQIVEVKQSKEKNDNGFYETETTYKLVGKTQRLWSLELNQVNWEDKFLVTEFKPSGEETSEFDNYSDALNCYLKKGKRL